MSRLRLHGIPQRMLGVSFPRQARQSLVADSHPSKGALRAGYATGGWVNLLAQSKTVEMGDQTWYLGRPWARVPWPVTDCEGSNHRRALRQLTYVVTIRTIITAILRTSTIIFPSVARIWASWIEQGYYW